MSENLSALIQHLQHLSQDQDVSSALTTDRSYQKALRDFWHGDFAAAADAVSSNLVDEPDSIARFACYRLWIEALSEQGDKASLRSLLQHLFVRAQAEPDDQATYLALRGIIHLELDEASAAKLFAKAVTGNFGDPYTLELCQRVDQRFGASAIPALARSTTRLDDFFHWQSLARGLLIHNAEEALQDTLHHIQHCFRGSPLSQVFEFHRCIERGYYAGAALVAERLVELYPDSSDYRYYHAYALFEDGNYPAARRILATWVDEYGETDAEFVGLLGHCHAKLGEPEQAKHYLQAAANLLKSEGMPSSHVRLELANVEEELRGEQLDPALELPRQTRMWLINLSPRRYHELQTSSESSIDRLLRPMGASPRPGDYCFFAAGDQESSQIQVVAIYAVDSEPMWHPTYHYHTALRLVSRLSEGIPVAVETAKDEAHSERRHIDSDDPFAYGVYELEIGALDIITEAVRQHNSGHRERRADGGRSRRTTG